jgi:hypothetical protein
MTRSLQFVVALMMLAVSHAAAQPRPGRRPPPVPPHLMMEQLTRMPASERDRLLSRLPEKRRMVVEERLRKYAETPEQVKRRIGEEFKAFDRLQPEQKEEVRQLFRRFSRFPDERRRVLRRELVRLRSMSEEQRNARLSSETFQQDFAADERDLLSNLTSLLAGKPSPEAPAAPSN